MGNCSLGEEEEESRAREHEFQARRFAGLVVSPLGLWTARQVCGTR